MRWTAMPVLYATHFDRVFIGEGLKDMATTYDPSVFDLAEHFLSDDDTNTQARAGVHHKRVDSLARTIQQAIEDWCEDEINEQEGE